MWRKGNCPTVLVEMYIGAATMENSMKFPQNTKNRTTIWSSNPLLAIYPNKTQIQKDTCTSLFTSELFTIAKTWKQANVHRQMNEKRHGMCAYIYMYTYIGTYIHMHVYIYTIHTCLLSRFSHVQLFVILWTRACQAPLSTGFPRQQYWSGLLCPPPEGSSWLRDWSQVSYISCLGRWFLYH